ncbi:acyltransferase [Photobacterium sp.]|uniref:acyltransferase n=1 Tax=Photobacterium sp. TaxID=660 RepID=UPI00299DCCD7|nr:acyltransferase [Photobacterium sp.]MDX1300757.1 acyltransferase [Photobacterium sp.]
MKRIYAFDSLKLLGIVAIFVIHYSIFYSYGDVEKNSIYLILNILARFAVPFFFVVAGYLYYFQSMTDSGAYTKRYLAKLIRMYLSWTLIYFVLAGIGYQFWRPYSFSSAFYHGTFGSEIMWFMPALTIAVLLQYIAQKFNTSTVLFAIASLLHLIGLSGQSYQALLPFEIFNPETNTFFINSRDPLFFGLFYVTLGYQLAKVNAVSLIKKLPWPVYLLGTVLFSGLSIAEGLWLIQGHGGIIADYYIMTLPVTLSLIALALSLPTVNKPSWFARIGEHSGEIYLNHGILNGLVMSVFWHMGVFSDPEVRAVVGNNLALQILLVPFALAVNLTFYFAIRSLFRRCFGKQTLSAYRESAMVLSAFWLLFIYVPNGQGENLFNSQSPMTMFIAVCICCMAYYGFVRWLAPVSSQQSIPIIKHIIVGAAVSGYWLALSAGGALEMLRSLYQQEANPFVSVLSSPLVTFSVLIVFSVGITLGLHKWLYAPNLNTREQVIPHR